MKGFIDIGNDDNEVVPVTNLNEPVIGQDKPATADKIEGKNKPSTVDIPKDEKKPESNYVLKGEDIADDISKLFSDIKRDNSDIEIGYLLGQRYRIEKLIGKGGMADVYLAKDIKDGKDVAVKILKQELTNDNSFIRRFDTEAKAVASLSNPNIVKVYDVGQENEIRYIILEYINGISLKELIEKNGHLDWEVALPIAIQIGLALVSAHKNGIIHRDIKPHNILITPDFMVKVADFGIALTTTNNTMTLTGKNTMGSVHYFSPEQARGGIVGEQSDIYSLGIVIYEMLTGKLPFDGDTSVSIALKHIQQQPNPPVNLNPDIPEGLNNIIMKCIQKAAESRYKTARELVNELDAFTIDPNGIYGYIEKYDENSKTSVISSIDRDPNFRKLRDIESGIKQKNKFKSRDRIIMLGAIILTVAILSGSGYFAFSWIKAQIAAPVAEYTIENYVGSKVEDVKKKLDLAKIKCDVFYEQNDTVAQGIVFNQSVPPGMPMRSGGASSITLKVSSGKNTVRLGDYKNKNYKLVESELRQILGLEVSIVKELSGEIAKDEVIGTIPGAGNDVAKGGKVQLIVSDGLINVTVPDVVGMKRSEALDLLKQNYLKVISEALLGNNPSLPEDQQYVIGIDPLPGNEVRALTGVIITLGSYDDYLNSELPGVTATPEPTIEPTQEPAVSTPTPATTAEPTSNKKKK